MEYESQTMDPRRCKNRFEEFMNFLNNDKMSGHNLERYLTAYCFINNIEFSFIWLYN